MKQSKVGHTRTGVTAANGEIGGILYKTPAQSGTSVLALDDNVKKRNQEAIEKYSVLNVSTVFYSKSKEKQGIIKEVMENFSSCFQGDTYNRRTGERNIGLLGACNRERIEEVYSFLELHTVSEENLDKLELTGEELAEKIISKALRNSLCREVRIPKKEGEKFDLICIAKELLLIISIEGSKEKLEDYPKKELLAFVNYVADDRKNIGKYAADSIRKQNVKVQPEITEGSEKKYLMLSNAEHKKKRWIAEFLKQYAGAKDIKDQEDMIWDKKKLILSYVYGREVVECEWSGNRGTVWGRMPVLSGAEDLFDQGISEPEQEGDSLDERQIKNARKEHFRAVINEENKETEEQFCERYFWLQYFDRCVEKLEKRSRKRKKVYFTCDALSNYLWKEWTSYIAMKYVDMGKGVYHFTKANLVKAKNLCEGSDIGTVNKNFQDGISSFDYERIKAEESLCRDIAVSATFASSVFGRAVAKDRYRQTTGKEDVLSYKQEIHDEVLYGTAFREDALRRLFQYFGGISRWNSGTDSREQNDGFIIHTGNKKTEKLFIRAGIRQIESIRNMSFHYSTSASPVDDADKELYDFTRSLFQHEYSDIRRMIGEKYCNNNVPVFYASEKICNLIGKLYEKHTEREAQIPSFQSVLKKNSVEMDKFIKRSNSDAFGAIRSDTDLLKKYQSSVYFLLKEIYYYDFLQREDLMQRFGDAMDAVGLEPENRFAFDDFKNRVDEIRESIIESIGEMNQPVKENKRKTWKKKDSPQKSPEDFIKKKGKEAMLLGMICQQVMSDVNAQNQGQKKILTNAEAQRAAGKNKKIYQHFDILLHQCMQKTFFSFVEHEYAFILEPVYREDWFENEKDVKMGRREKKNEKIEEFIKKVPEVQKFGFIKAVMEKENENRVVEWYMLAHFLQGKQLNLLLGDIRSYLRYLENINERAGMTKNRKEDIDTKKKHYEKVLAVLEFVQMFSGRVSHEITDYFSTEEYLQHLASYVDFGGVKQEDLLDFCKTSDENSKSTDHAIGLYVDGRGNPILNRNIIHAMMFGDEKKLEKCVEKVTLKEIRKYYRLSAELETVFQTGICEAKEEWTKLKEFQNLKNRIELFDVSVYADIVNDMLGQLISWAYLRERDLLYFQLGYHYIRLYYTDAIPAEDKFRQLRGDTIDISDGAILYQIIAMYDYSKKIYKVGDDGVAIPSESQGTAGTSITGFVVEYCNEGTNSAEEAPTYHAGLNFFEDVNRHDEFAFFRNTIAHLKYMIRADDNLWDMYGKIYNGFFFYDTKLRKSVSYIIKNILERYFVIAYTEMDHADEKSGFQLRLRTKMEAEQMNQKKEDDEKKNRGKKNTKKNWGLQSDQHVRQRKGENRGKPAYADARSEIFLKQLEKILGYKDVKKK